LRAASLWIIKTARSSSSRQGNHGLQTISVKTSFAPIQVRPPEGTGYNVNARTSFGHI